MVDAANALCDGWAARQKQDQKLKRKLMKFNQTNKPLVAIVTLAMAICFSGCRTNRNNMSMGHVTPPVVEDVNAHLNPGQPIKGTGEIKTLEILGIKFSGGGSQKVGTVGNGLYVKPSPTLNPLRWLFGSPANVNAAVDSAYYDAVDESDADGIISTRMKAEKTGWTFLHIIGWGTATAEVKGREVTIEKGQLPRPSNQPSILRQINNPIPSFWDWIGLGWIGY